MDDTRLISPLMRRRHPAAHTLMKRIVMPVDPLRDIIRFRLRQLDIDPKRIARVETDLIQAILDHFFLDAEAAQWEACMDHIGRWVFMGSEDDFKNDLLGALHQLITSTIGSVMPSFLYRYEVLQDVFVIHCTLPTLEDHQSRIRAIVDTTDGWVPPQYR